MPLLPLNQAADNWFATLNAAIDGSQTSIVLAASGASGAPGVPFIFNIGSEKLRCTEIAVDTPSGELDTLTVTRGYGGTSPTTHKATEIVEQAVYSDFFNDPGDLVLRAAALLVASLGRQNGVQKTYPDEDDLQIFARSQPDLTIDIHRGAGVVNENPVALLEAAETTLAAPTILQWIALIQISETSEIVVKYGAAAGSPVAPAVDADAMALAHVYIDLNGIVTAVDDRRVFL
jgi:hypothetical protein